MRMLEIWCEAFQAIIYTFRAIMRNSIAISIDGVFTGDFGDKIPAPQFIEDNEEGVTFLFDDINELRQYKDSLPEDDE